MSTEVCGSYRKVSQDAHLAVSLFVKATSGLVLFSSVILTYRGAVKSLARTGRKQATATEDFDFHISYL